MKTASFSFSSFRKTSFSFSSFRQTSFQQQSFQQNSFQQQSFQQNSFQQQSFQQNSFQQKSFQQNSFQQKSFQQNSFQQKSLQQTSSFQDNSFNSSFSRRTTSTELLELQTTASTFELSELQRKNLTTELSQLYLRTLLQRGSLAILSWEGALNCTSQRGSAKQSFPSLELDLTLAHLGSSLPGLLSVKACVPVLSSIGNSLGRFSELMSVPASNYMSGRHAELILYLKLLGGCFRIVFCICIVFSVDSSGLLIIRTHGRL